MLGSNQMACAEAGSFPETGCTQNRSFLECSKIPDVAGSYTGTLQDADSGPGTITLTIAQKGNHITGVWGTSYPNGEGNGGRLTGTVSRTSVHAKLTTPFAHCFYTVLVSISVDRFQGTFADNRRCPEEDGGSFTIPRSP